MAFGRAPTLMNNANAFGFLTLGTVMQVLPFLAPSAGSFASTSDLWLHVMGGVTGSIGAGYLVHVGFGQLSAYFTRVAANTVAARHAAAARNARGNLPLGVRVTF